MYVHVDTSIIVSVPLPVVPSSSIKPFLPLIPNQTLESAIRTIRLIMPIIKNAYQAKKMAKMDFKEVVAF